MMNPEPVPPPTGTVSAPVTPGDRPSAASGSVAAVLLAVGLLLSSGCRQMGPTTIRDARFDYSRAIAGSSAEMNLLSLVQLRYSELPVFLEVDQVVAGYSQEHVGGLDLDLRTPFNAGKNEAGVEYTARFTERPTITYSLMSGERFVRTFIHPLDPEILLGLTDGGWPIDRLFWITVHAVNGMRNHRVGAGELVPADAGFVQFLSVMRQAQLLDAYSVVSTPGKESPRTQLRFHHAVLTPELEAELREALTAMGLDPDCRSFDIVEGRMSSSPTTIAIHARSVFSIMLVLAAHVEVPPSHVERGIAGEIRHVDAETDLARVSRLSGGFHVRSGLVAPPDALVSVRHQGHAFWIRGDDLISRAVFGYLSLLVLLTQTGEADRPQLTISAN